MTPALHLVELKTKIKRKVRKLDDSSFSTRRAANVFLTYTLPFTTQAGR